MSADPQTFFVLSSTSLPAPISFKTEKELADFIDDEVKYWRSVCYPLADSDQAAGAIWSTINQGWNNFKQQLPGYRNNVARQQPLESLFNQFVTSARIPLSKSRSGQIIGDLQQSQKQGAVYCLAFVMNSYFNPSIKNHLRAAIDYELREQDIHSESLRQRSSQFSKLEQRYEKQLNLLTESTGLQFNSFEKSNAYNQRLVRIFPKLLDRRRRQVQKVNDDRISASIANFQAVEKSYVEYMKLRAPVEYWSGKATEHKNKAAKYRNTLVIFAIVMGLALILGLWELKDQAVMLLEGGKPSAILALLATIGVVAATIVFWAARILTRLFLSEHHLAIDAGERTVMVSTYLALTSEGKVSESERNLVLASLFRPTSDGIVKDDAAPDISPASLLSRLLAGRQQ